jgi:hypothetical protein
MMREIQEGAKGVNAADHTGTKKLILARGCDPVMAQRSAEFLPPLLGGATLLTFTDDDSFFAEIEQQRSGAKQKADVVFFAPGACRWAAARKPIPGGNKVSAGWAMKDYHKKVREALGEGVPIVGSENERDIVPLLRQSLGLDK